MCHNILQVNESLYRKGINDHPSFNLCNSVIETCLHLFFGCCVVAPIWRKLRDWTGMQVNLDMLSPRFLKYLCSYDVVVGNLN